MQAYYSHIDTPVGAVAVAVDEDGAVTELYFVNESSRGPYRSFPERAAHDPGRLKDVAAQVTEFFARKREVFDLPLRPAGTPFQQKVWQALCDIPFGRTISYQQLAIAVGDIKATQAVGAANGKNPISLIIPCHRVIGKNGSLTGYGGGLPLKRALLDFESPGLL